MMLEPIAPRSAVVNRHDVTSNIAIAGRIQAARERLGVSQGELSRRMNALGANATRPETISRYESGKYVPSADALVYLANALTTTVDYLLGRVDDPRPATSTATPEPEVYSAFVDFCEKDPKGQEMTDAERAMLRAMRLPEGEEPSANLYLQWLLSYRMHRSAAPSRPARKRA